MRIPYHNLEIELGMEGIISIESVQISQRLNEHGRAVLRVLTAEEEAAGLVEQTDSSLCVTIRRKGAEGHTLFCGRAEQVYARKEEGLYYLYMEFYGHTREWDLTAKSQSFCHGNDTYEQVCHKVLSEYGAKEIRNEAAGGTKIPGMLLQYEETDWEFLKRLASHFSTFLLTDNTQAHGKVYFGIPVMDYGTVLKDEEYTVLRGKERYERMEDAAGILSQEMTGWRVKSRKDLRFGEQVMLGHIATVVTAVDIHTEKGELVTEYELSRRKGILTAKKKNPRIYGMSIPATVKERKGNQIRVHFDIDPVYEASDDMKYFTYAIETSNFYCMPEEGSRVHVYFPSHDEQDAMAVHALSAGSVPGGAPSGAAAGMAVGMGGTTADYGRTSGGASAGERSSGGSSNSGGSSLGGGSSSGGGYGGGASAAAGGMAGAGAQAASAPKEKAAEKKAPAKDPAYKRFSDPSGSFMELAPYGITFSPGSGSTALLLDQTGVLSLSAYKVNFIAGTTLYAGGGKDGPIPAVYAMAQTEVKVGLNSGDSSITMKEDTDIKATFIKKDAELKKDALPRAAMLERELTANDAQMREEYNTGAKETLTALAAKKKEGERKIREGIFSILTVVASVAVVVATGGAAAPLVAAMAVTGGFKTVSAISDIAEGVSDVEKAEKGDLSQSYNFMRDTVFQGNEMLYETAKGVNDMVFGFVTGKAVKTNMLNPDKATKAVNLLRNGDKLCNGSKKANYIANIGGDVAMGCVEDYVQNGSINPANVALNVGTGMFKGWGMNKIQIPCKNSGIFKNKILRKTVNTASGTTFGMGTDFFQSMLKGEEYDWKQSLGQNLFQAGAGQAFGEPIDAATGAFLMSASDYILPDITDPIELTRSYRSTDRRCGWMGKGWHFSYESRLCRDGETVHAQLPDGYRVAFAGVNDAKASDTDAVNGDVEAESISAVRESAGGISYGVTYMDIIGNGRYSLLHDAMSGMWSIRDSHAHKEYRYSAEGLLVSVTDKNGCRLTLSYRGEYPEKLTTALGYEIFFTFTDGKLTGLKDGTGRTMTYHYKNGLLSHVVHMDGGMSRYDYTQDGYLERPTDQTGLSYLTNCYDEHGRVVLQTLANGETYRVSYHDKERKTCMEYSAYPGEKTYIYNEKMAVTQVLYPDGTKEAFVFDAKNNRIVETDRLGRSIHKAYDEKGRLIREERPQGLVTEYVYNEMGDLVLVHDNGGRSKEISYDDSHNLIIRRTRTAEGQWIEQSYAYDSMGRLIKEQDGEGHATRYSYRDNLAYPYRTVYADGSEVWYEYDPNGRMLSEEDSTGKTEYGYNRGGWQTMVRDGEGNETHYFYDGMGRKLACYRPKQWMGKSGKRTEYRYDFLERLIDTVYADGSHEKLFRDGEGNILKEVHPNAYDPKTKDGEGTCYEHDGDGNLLRIRHADGGVERFFYDSAGNKIKHVLPQQYDTQTDDGEGWSYSYDEENRLLSVTGPDGNVEESYGYDKWGNCVRKTDAEGFTTHYTYDLAGRMVRMLEPCGSGKEDLSYGMTSYAYDNNGNRIKEIRHGGRYGEDGSLVEAGEDLVLTSVYDARDRLVRMEDGLGARVSYRYDARGNRIYEEQVIRNAESENAGNGEERPVLRRIRYFYDKAGRLTEKREMADSGLADRVSGEDGTAITRYRYDANGNRTRIVTPEGYHISRSYDERDRLVMERVEDKENGIDRRTYITYDYAGNVTGVRQKGAEGTERKIAFGYDLKDRLTRSEEMDGPVFLASYDRNDRISMEKELLPMEKEQYSESVYAYDRRGNLTERYKNGVKSESNRYDNKNRLMETTDGDGVEVHCLYGIGKQQRAVTTANSRREDKAVQILFYNARGQVTGVEDGCGARTSYTLDGWGRITSIETAEGGREKYVYDAAGNVAESIDTNGGIIKYAYNSQGLVCAITDQSGNRETFRYDKEGRQTEHTDRNGTITETRYNVYGQPVLQVCTDKNGRREVMGTWEYDSFGQLKKSVAGGFSYTYEYSPDGKLLRKWSSGRKVLDCAYYRDGSLKSLTDAGGKTTSYEYDGNGQLKYLKDESGKVLTEYRYTKAGRLEEIRTQEGINTCYGYDDDGNLTRLTIGSKEEDTLLYDAFMRYDLNGNRIKKSGSRLGVDGEVREMAICYHYDAMNRLTEEDRNGEGEKYAYDRNGNRLKKEHYKNGIIDVAETYCYNERNELTSRKRGNVLTSYLYDANGNLLSEKSEGKSSEYCYDLLNRTTFVRTLDGREQENRYDGEGLRAGLTENGKETAFVFHQGEILTECDAESTPTRRHLFGIGLAHSQTLSDGVYHTYHQDEQGSTAYITGENRQTENIYHYDAFGNMLESRERTQNRILYTGQQYDQETGQYYLRARYYNPVIGRFMQEDSYRGDGLNLYAYCANNPVVYYDPSGHKADCGGQAHNKTEQPKHAGESGTSSKVHGNSKLSTKPQHGYEIYNTETGDVVKTGISGQKMNLNGTSPRANTQVNKLNKSAGKNLYDSRIVATDMPNRLSALEWERENALRLWNEGNSMSLHKRPRPWEE